jgi:D-proline reductase (dithiol) PrdB
MCCWSVGLVQRAIEAAGVSTICLSTIWEFTRSVSAPRVAAIEHPQGRPLGQPGDRDGQIAVLRAALDALQSIDRPGGVVHLPFTWPEPPKTVRSAPDPLPPIALHIARRPWLYFKFVKGEIPD